MSGFKQTPQMHLFICGALSPLFLSTNAMADAVANTSANAGAKTTGFDIGKIDWSGFHEPVTTVMHDITHFHNVILVPIIFAVALFVLGLLIWVMIRYNEKSNPKPASFTHNSTIEIIWTALPVLLLLFISIYSFPLLYKADVVPEKYDITLKVTGNQWFWQYEYPDEEGISLTANMLSREDAKAQNRPAMLATDEVVILPVNKTVRVQVTAADVIHSWAVPSFGVKIDAIPGKLNETWFRVEKTGTYYGQCSEICGVKHYGMPIEIHVVSEAEYQAWLASQKSADTTSIQFAAK